jgi:hypothetical protein
MHQSKYRVSVNKVNNGVQHIYSFPNGYGASVIKHDGSYGGNLGLWELAVLDDEGSLCYSTPITSDVIGHLSDEEVILKLNEIRGLQTS